ncbi:MAG: hypothetical protein GY950_02205 [bacterium]|nr:hypothetical protein [bacterium]
MLEDFKKAVADIWLRDGQNTWPIDMNSIVHLFMDIFFKELAEDIRRLKDNGMDDAGVARKFKTSARIIRLIMPCVPGMKGAGIPMTEQREHVSYLLSLVKILKHGELFNSDGKNIVLSPAAFGRGVAEDKMVPADRKSSIAVHKLCAVLWNYAESVCFKTHGLVREFHGPYRFPGKEEEVLLRDFYSLQPLELWEECKPVAYQNVRVVTAYRDLGMTIDIYNNVSTREGRSYIAGLESYYVEGDGKILSLEEIKGLCAVLSEVMIAVTTRIETFDWRRLAEKYAEIFWFSKKELRDALNRDWRFPPVVRERIKNGQLSTRLQNLDQRSLQRMLRIAF